MATIPDAWRRCGGQRLRVKQTFYPFGGVAGQGGGGGSRTGPVPRPIDLSIDLGPPCPPGSQATLSFRCSRWVCSWPWCHLRGGRRGRGCGCGPGTCPATCPARPSFPGHVLLLRQLLIGCCAPHGHAHPPAQGRSRGCSAWLRRGCACACASRLCLGNRWSSCGQAPAGVPGPGLQGTRSWGRSDGRHCPRGAARRRGLRPWTRRAGRWAPSSPSSSPARPSAGSSPGSCGCGRPRSGRQAAGLVEGLLWFPRHLCSTPGASGGETGGCRVGASGSRVPPSQSSVLVAWPPPPSRGKRPSSLVTPSQLRAGTRGLGLAEDTCSWAGGSLAGGPCAPHPAVFVRCANPTCPEPSGVPAQLPPRRKTRGSRGPCTELPVGGTHRPGALCEVVQVSGGQPFGPHRLGGSSVQCLHFYLFLFYYLSPHGGYFSTDL